MRWDYVVRNALNRCEARQPLTSFLYLLGQGQRFVRKALVQQVASITHNVCHEAKVSTLSNTILDGHVICCVGHGVFLVHRLSNRLPCARVTP